MKIIVNPQEKEWDKLLARPGQSNPDIWNAVREIIGRIQRDGDHSIRSYTKQYDGVDMETFTVSEDEIATAVLAVDEKLKEAIVLAKKNIERFHATGIPAEDQIETMPGVTCWRESRPIKTVGLYVPGGTAPLFSTVLMLAIPARIAGCNRVFICTPANAEGLIDPAILYAAQLCGVREIYKVGGAQAITAMAYGTETIPAADKIFGPGNRFVTTAKQIVNMEKVATDMPAGPSEVLVIADEYANPVFVAADLLSQAEHGIDSQVILISTTYDMAVRVVAEVEDQIIVLPRKEIVSSALKNSRVFVIEGMDRILNMANLYAPEHLVLNLKNPEEVLQKIDNAGSVFVGPLTPEAAGDYASGTNHTLPTNGFARSYSGLSVENFVKKITFQKIEAGGLERIGPAIEIMADAEQLIAHKNAVSLRLRQIRGIQGR